jgi:lysophospholipase L1-like esterase
MRYAPRIAAVIALPLLLALTSIQTTPDLSGYPNSMAATGDSITKAYNTGPLPFSEAPGNSWSTGTRDVVQSHYVRILASHPDISGRNFNEAVSGAKMAGLTMQVQRVNDRGVAYVTILIGGNDLCTPALSQMTSVSDFRSQFERAMAVLSAGSPRARIYVVSIPNVYRLWTILKDNLVARTTWRTFDICQSLLARPLSTDTADVARRRAVRRRSVGFNTQLAEVCAQYIHCRFDQNAVFSDPFQPTDVSTRDYFHPSLDGERRLARVTWGASFDFSDQTPPVTTLTTSVIDGGLIVSLTATDDVGVAGIEYRLDLGEWQRYTAPFALVTGSNIRFRTVDVNGNIEATQSLTA